MRVKAALVALTVSVLLVVGGCASTQPGSDHPHAEDITLWLVSGSTHPRIRDYLVQQYAAVNGGVLTIVEKSNAEIMTELPVALPEVDASPDVVEIATTWFPALADSFADISDLYQPLGGSKMLQPFVEIGKIDGQNRTLPYYYGSRYVFYRKDIWAGARVPAPPTTLEEFNQAVVTIAEKNPQEIAHFSGIYLGSRDWRNAIAWVFANGGELAKRQDGAWVATLSDPQTIVGLTQWQQLQQSASRPPKVRRDDMSYIYLNDTDSVLSETGKTIKTSLSAGAIIAPDSARQLIGTLKRDDIGELSRTWDDQVFGVFPLPGVNGKPAPVFVGGANIGIWAKSQHQVGARQLLGIIFSGEYQTMLGQTGLPPANSDFFSALGNDQFASAMIASAVNSKLPPAAPGWAAIERSGLLEEFFQQIADGGDVVALAGQYDATLTPLLNATPAGIG